MAAQLPATWLEPSLSAGRVWLASLDGHDVATLTLDHSDPIWPPDGVVAGYVHRLAVRRHVVGLGTALLAWAGDQVRAAGGDALRLDCVSWNARLRAYYEAAGFHHRGDVPVPVPPEFGHPVGAQTFVSRYERPI